MGIRFWQGRRENRCSVGFVVAWPDADPTEQSCAVEWSGCVLPFIFFPEAVRFRIKGSVRTTLPLDDLSVSVLQKSRGHFAGVSGLPFWRTVSLPSVQSLQENIRVSEWKTDKSVTMKQRRAHRKRKSRVLRTYQNSSYPASSAFWAALKINKFRVFNTAV